MTKNRKNRAKAAAKTAKKSPMFEQVRPNVAGVDLGSREHWVCAPSKDGGEPEICSFRTTTAGLEELVRWMLDRGVESVAMESTSVYWVPLYDMIEEAGLEAVLANARHVKHVPGRKSDVQDCQWLQRLHAAGLITGSFRPHESITALRTLQRQKKSLVTERTRAVQWMQKSLDQMNVAVHRAVSDITGATGMAIIRAIVAGERDPHSLAELRDYRCTSSVEAIAEHLTGTWREEHLFNLCEALELYDHCQASIARYDAELLRQIRALNADPTVAVPPHPNERKAKAIRRANKEELRAALFSWTGIDLTTIDGISADAALSILTEVGTDLSKFPTEKHFVSWAGLSPKVGFSAGKPVKRGAKGLGQTAVNATLRMCASTLRRSQTALGARYRRVASRKDAKTAVKDVARQLARIVYRALRYGKQYVDEGIEAYEERFRTRRLHGLKTAAKNLGFDLVERAVA